MSVSTHDDYFDQDIQTDPIDSDESWTQNNLSAKSQNALQRDNYSEKFSILPTIPLQRAATLASVLLEEIEEEAIQTKLEKPKSMAMSIKVGIDCNTVSFHIRKYIFFLNSF